MPGDANKRLLDLERQVRKLLADQTAMVTAGRIPGGSITAAKIEAQEAWRVVGAGGQPAFTNSWVAYGGTTYAPPRFYKDSLGIVHLSGCVKSGVVASPAFTLPVGYRPLYLLLFSALTGTGATWGAVSVIADGGVNPYAGVNTLFCLDGISFRAEQ
jgi:hypothetical protein